MRVAEWQYRRVSQAHDGHAENLRERAGHLESRIAEMLDVIPRVIVGMISAVTAIEIKLDRQSGKAQVILKGDEIGAAAECGQLDLEILWALETAVGRLFLPVGGAPIVVDAEASIEVGNIFGNL